MSVICTDIEEQLDCKGVWPFTAKFIRATINPSSIPPNFPFHNDYKFAPCFLTKKYETIVDQVQNFKVRNDDVWILGYPKSGNTWLHNIILHIREESDISSLVSNIFHLQILELGMVFGEPDDEKGKEAVSFVDSSLDRLNNEPSPRIVRSHLPAHLLPAQLWTVKPKIIYIARNPKDVAISFYQMHRNEAFQYKGTLNDMLEVFLNDHFLWAPIHNHVMDFWKIRHLENILFLTYEQLSADRFAGIKRISEFLGYNHSDQRLLEISENVSFDRMRKNWKQSDSIFGEKVQDEDYKFVRKGKVAGYRDEMSEEYIEKFDKWTAERLKNSDFKYAA